MISLLYGNGERKGELYNKNLIGKRAKIKKNEKRYPKNLWNKQGIIIKSENTPFMYLKLDEIVESNISKVLVFSKILLYENSYELIRR